MKQAIVWICGELNIVNVFCINNGTLYFVDPKMGHKRLFERYFNSDEIILSGTDEFTEIKNQML